MSEPSSRNRLLNTAASLFRRKGYDGVGLAEILSEAGLPKGSLYHHFPGGKRELAEEATLWVGGIIENVVAEAFVEAGTFREGAANTCRAIARLATQQERLLACPVMSMLQAASQDPELRQVACTVLDKWKRRLAGYATQFGCADPEAAAEQVLVMVQGAWILALADQSGAPLERLAERLLRDPAFQ
ncbi:TetR/AcrR family transcriptional regulator [Roseibium aggregatum]|uniref:TetR/AcrR family transcriptional regulator n=1 Tax=Roseibium aggregatum TaxID=187304 RepID=A0A939EJ82_9HYPH|nr:TetR/AcrR family transcriptional regulator [Roseibium aggregatum]MBN9673968.1 TetR/AcrR family transcriptional regulator [Roseibium aggregatum]